MAKQRKVSLKDVANSLGVSTTLVSIVLNGKAKQYRIADEMAQRVVEEARKMNYSPNIVARNLRGGKTQLIGLIVTDISNPFFSNLARIIENRANELNYTVVYGSSDEKFSNTHKLVNVLLNKGIDGLIVVPCDGSEKVIQNLHERGMPTVLVDRYIPALNLSYSCLNNHRATELATKHLINQGYERISIIAYRSNMSNIVDRIAGYEETMKSEGLAEYINIKRVGFSDPRPEINKAVDYLINKKQTEAIIFITNALSVNGLHCLSQMNIKVPDNVAVVGFDQNDVFDLFYSPITYIKQPISQIAVEAVDILVDKIKNGERAKRAMVILEPELIVAKSSLKNH
jgi:LacI family transcriptional regulator